MERNRKKWKEIERNRNKFSELLCFAFRVSSFCWGGGDIVILTPGAKKPTYATG